MSDSPFSPAKAEKDAAMLRAMRALTAFHRERCPAYRGICEAFGVREPATLEDVPMLPVSLFKELELRSVPKEDVFKVMTSSGTTGQRVSRIYLDRATAAAQQKALARIVTDFTGSARLPMLILDCPGVVKDRAMFSARGAGVLGFSIFGTDRTYALNDDMSLNEAAVRAFVERHAGQRMLLFGFTFMVWRHFYREVAKRSPRLDLGGGVLIHGGGWKKLAAEAVGPEEFRRRLADACGISDVHNYYGMVEQTGSIFMECGHGHLHASEYSEVVTRRARDLRPCEVGEKGVIQVMSTLPASYPGHSLLTEDEGVILGHDDCPCGRKGTYFSVLGRLGNAEIRGCSDTYELPRA